MRFEIISLAGPQLLPGTTFQKQDGIIGESEYYCLDENLRIYSHKKSGQQNWRNLKLILINISVYHTKLYGENPWIILQHAIGRI